MSCLEFDKLIVSLACDTLASGSLRAQALAHAATCARCGARLAQQQMVAEGLDALAVQEQSMQAPAHLGAALLAEFERHQMLAAPQSVSSEPIRFRLVSLLNWRWATASAAVLLVVGLTAILWRQPVRRTSPVQKEIAATPLSSPVSTSANNETKMVAKISPKPKRKKTARHNADEYGALISLMPIAPTEREEFQQVVSMQIPRSTLRLWGLPLNEESDSEQISAKVYFSEDGVARAIRLHN